MSSVEFVKNLSQVWRNKGIPSLIFEKSQIILSSRLKIELEMNLITLMTVITLVEHIRNTTVRVVDKPYIKIYLPLIAVITRE